MAISNRGTRGIAWSECFVLIVLISLSLLRFATSFGQEQTGRIVGQVIDKTERTDKGKLIKSERFVPNQTITLHTLKDMAEWDAPLRATVTDSDGRFVFEGVDSSGEYDYLLTTTYLGVEYSKRAIAYNEKVLRTDPFFVVYDTTSQSVHPIVIQHHIFIEPFQDSLLVQEFLRFQNNQNVTYVGVPSDVSNLRETLKFSLPDGASTLQFQAGLSETTVTFFEDGFSDSQPLLPGRREVLFSYTLPFTQKMCDFRKFLHYAHYKFDLFVASRDIEVSSPDLVHAGVFGSADARSIRYSGQNVQSGREIAITMNMIASRTGTSVWLLVGALAAILFVSLRVVFLKRRERRLTVSKKLGLETHRKREELIEAIADLDERYERGEVQTDAYRRKRDRMKKTLSQIMKERMEK